MASNAPSHNTARPLIAITSDLMIRNDRPTAFLTTTYAESVLEAGGLPVVLPPMSPDPEIITALISRFDAFILSGGDDPQTESFGTPSHPAITPVLTPRLEFESELLVQLNNAPEIPVLGICLGMQMLALTSSGTLNQHLPDTHDSHASHWEHAHEINSSIPSLASGQVWSKHRQAVSDPGTMQVVATASDGVIEAIRNPEAKFCLGVQWHPERTESDPLGQDLFRQLVSAAGG